MEVGTREIVVGEVEAPVAAEVVVVAVEVGAVGMAIGFALMPGIRGSASLYFYILFV